MGKELVWIILNKIQSEEMQSLMLDDLKKRNVSTLGVIHYDSELVKVGLVGTQLRKSNSLEDLKFIIKRLEEAV